MTSKRIVGDDRKRFRSRYEVDESTGCFLWLGGMNTRGYGIFYIDGKTHLAHRAAWFLEYGAFPEPPLVTDHICEVKRCVNVEHLRLLTNRENILRSANSPMNVKLARTACSRGHEYTPATMFRDHSGHRQCRICFALRGDPRGRRVQ